MRKLTRISEFNNKQRLHLMKERPMKGKGLLEVLTRLHKLYKIAAPIVKATNSIYRAPCNRSKAHHSKICQEAFESCF